MRLALVAMPWTNFDMPSPALGALAAVVRRDAPAWDVTAHYAYLGVWSGLHAAYEAIARDDRMGELIYALQLYPERRQRVAAQFAAWVAEESARDECDFDRIVEHTGEHVRSLAAQMAGKFDVVGLTTSYCQLFPSLVLAQHLRGLDGRVRIVLGGMGVPYHIGPSVLRQYPWVDYVIQGEGEERLLHLLGAVERGGEPSDPDGILGARDTSDDAVHRAPLRGEVASLDALPVPDYSDYEAQAEPHRIAWHVPVEASRGCWWDRVKRTGNATDTCYFCSLNTSSYRHKSTARVAEEVGVLADRHGRLRFRFLDNIVRHRGVGELGEALRGLGKQLRFFYELRAQLSPRDILSLWEAGCDTVQIGVEGLSSAYLDRIGKGTSAIQNLQAMKTCYELGIYSGSNLLIGFPGATPDEVDATAECIRRHASVYQPLEVVEFALYINNTVFRVPERFGVSNVRNAAVFEAALPDDVFRSMQLYWLDYDRSDEPPDWTPVREAVAEWRELHTRLTLEDGTEWFLGRKPLVYRDGGSFLEVVDRRHGLDVYTVRGLLRDVYLACMQIRTRAWLAERFAEDGGAELERVLGAFVATDLMMTERGAYLSLAVADRPDLAAARIGGM